jgi:hypothetical protein
MECGLAISMPVYGVAKAPVGNLPPLYTPCPGAVPIIPLPGISLSNFASRHAAEWFHISREKLCYQSQFLPPSQVAITLVYRHSHLSITTSYRHSLPCVTYLLSEVKA